MPYCEKHVRPTYFHTLSLLQRYKVSFEKQRTWTQINDFLTIDNHRSLNSELKEARR